MSALCIFGDSIAWGAHDSVGGWVARLRTRLEREEKDVDVYNLGVSGDTSDDLLLRFMQELCAREATHVVIAIGINDSQYAREGECSCVPLERFEENLRTMIDVAQRVGAEIVLLGLTRVNEALVQPVSRQGDCRYANERIETYDRAVQNIADAHGCTYLSVAQTCTPDDLADGLHPNNAGHEKIYRVVYNKYETTRKS